MRVRHVFISSAVIAAALAGPAGATLPTPKLRRIVPGRSIAGVRIGQSAGDALAAWGPGETCINRVDGNCDWITLKQGVASITLRTGRVRREVSITAGSGDGGYAFGGTLPELRTSRGIGLGSTRAQVVRAYPAVRLSGAALLVVSHRRVTSFTIADRRVVVIAIRAQAARRSNIRSDPSVR